MGKVISAKREVNDWLGYMLAVDMPVMSNSIRRMHSVISDRLSSDSELAEVIKHDPAMTAKILKVANSVQFNTSGTSTDTISRAVMVLGYDTVKTICQQITPVEEFVSGEMRTQALTQIAQSIHAAVQAEAFAKRKGERNTEEIFIAALLYNIGELTFWCLGGDHAKHVLKLMKESDMTFAEAEKQVLGFGMKEFTSHLAEIWNLGDSFQEALTASEKPQSRWHAIKLGNDLATYPPHEWNKLKSRPLIDEVAKFLGIQAEETLKILQKNADDALQVIHNYRLDEAIEPTKKATKAVPNAAVQAQITEKLVLMTAQKTDINIILQTILEGLHLGVGLDRAVVAILSNDRRYLRTKFILETQATELTQSFDFDLADSANMLFNLILKKHIPLWIGSPEFASLKKFYTPSIENHLLTSEFLMAPILIGEREIGIFYADRYLSQQPLDALSFDSFKKLTKKGNLCLELVTKMGLKK